MKKRVRQTDVARLAGVSPATVSLVINNRSGGSVRISEETRQRVLDAVNQLSYVVDPAARSLAGGQNSLLGVFTYESIFPLQHRDFYYRFLVGIEEEAEAIGYDLLLFTSSKGEDGRRRIYNNGVNRLGIADGAVLLGASEDKAELQRLRGEGYTFVFIGRREVDDSPIAYVGADYATATAEVVQHMLAHGHRQVVYIGHATKNESQLDR
ncbi:MAG: LacI family DNA-binding transcriptional regulator, partial [Anaerolineae bacterium]|nr:LacI family DNA-binding transcriptional regulator [Anaerolineae bacterium]